MDAVIFDWGGTLSQWVSIEVKEFWRPAAEVLDPGRVEEVTHALHDAEAATWERVRGDQHAARLDQIVLAGATAAGLSPSAEELAAATDAYLGAWAPLIFHAPDALPTLAACKAMGLRTGLLSNTHWPRTFHESFLARDGLDVLIDERLYTSELPRVKPHPIAFRAALAALDVPASRAVYVGDRFYDDVFGAQSSGLRAVLVGLGQIDDYPVTPDARIETLSELIGVLDGWLDADERLD